MKVKISFLAVAVMLCCGFGAFKTEKKSAPSPDRPLPARDLPAGHALLFKLVSDEKDLSKLLIIKRENRTLHDLIKEISSVTGDAHKSLEKLGKAAGINLQDQQLPAAEASVRESIAKEKAKQLLGAKGDDLQFLLLLDQSEALNYGRHLALVLAKGETDLGRRQFFESLAAHFAGLEERVVALLRNS
jgi:hypothetical protein